MALRPAARGRGLASGVSDQVTGASLTAFKRSARYLVPESAAVVSLDARRERG